METVELKRLADDTAYWKTRALIAEQELKNLKRDISFAQERSRVAEEAYQTRQCEQSWNTDMGR